MLAGATSFFNLPLITSRMADASAKLCDKESRHLARLVTITIVLSIILIALRVLTRHGLFLELRCAPSGAIVPFIFGDHLKPLRPDGIARLAAEGRAYRPRRSRFGAAGSNVGGRGALR